LGTESASRKSPLKNKEEYLLIKEPRGGPDGKERTGRTKGETGLLFGRYDRWGLKADLYKVKKLYRTGNQQKVGGKD